jgi:DNA-binding response OmpR family regulator
VIHGNHSGKIDVVLTDIALPGKDGCQLVRTLIETDPNLCAVFVSGLAGAELCRFYGLATSDVHFLAKPFAAAELLRRIRRVLKAGGPYLTRVAG